MAKVHTFLSSEKIKRAKRVGDNFSHPHRNEQKQQKIVLMIIKKLYVLDRLLIPELIKWRWKSLFRTIGIFLFLFNNIL